MANKNLPSFLMPLTALPRPRRAKSRRPLAAPVRAAAPTAAAPAAAPPAAAPAAAPPVLTHDALPGFFVEQQRYDYWCWAAVSVSVARFYRTQRNWQQCEVANLSLGCSQPNCNCCGAQGPAQCNRWWALEGPLRYVLGRNIYPSGRVSPQVIMNAIAARRVLCARIMWPGGLGHFVAIGAWWTGPNNAFCLRAFDPRPGKPYVDSTYDDFIRNYDHAQGQWTGTYPT